MKDYVHILKEEAALTADIAIESLGPSAQAAVGYKKLHAWARTGLIAAALA